MSARPLDESLRQELAQMQALLAGLDAERQALLARDPEALVRASQAKAAALQAMEACAEARAGVELPPRQPAAARLWQQLLELAESGHAQNRQNAQLLEAHRARTLWALRFLGADSPVYARDGQSSPGAAPSRTLARA